MKLAFTPSGFKVKMIPLAKVFTVTKNEYDLIEDFINYYGRIFGYGNVVILDNGSDNQAVLDVYTRYSTRGVTIRTVYGYEGGKQGEHFTQVMREYRDKAEFLIGLDTDCFFCVNGKCDPSTIQQYLRSLPMDRDKFIMKKFLMSVVDATSENYRDNKYVRPTDCTKFVLRTGYSGTECPHVFFRASNFVSTSVGNHSGETTTGREFFCEDVCYVHYHETGRKRHVERCKTILLAYGYIHESMTPQEQLDTLIRYPNGGGIHRQRQYISYLQDPNSFLQEDPVPADVIEFTEVKKLLA